MRALSRKESTAVDVRACVELRIPSLCLMENAGAGAARIATEMLVGRSGGVVCVCGPGGNGGDAMVVARHLAIAGARVELLLIERPASGDAVVQLAICEAMRLECRQTRDLRAISEFLDEDRPPALIVDGLFGTGIARPIGGVASDLVTAVNESGAPVLSLDLPSGLDCDSGLPLGPCVRADVTATFVASKLGFSNPASLAWTGEVRIVSIGAPVEWPLRAVDLHDGGG